MLLKQLCSFFYQCIQLCDKRLLITQLQRFLQVFLPPSKGGGSYTGLLDLFENSNPRPVFQTICEGQLKALLCCGQALAEYCLYCSSFFSPGWFKFIITLFQIFVRKISVTLFCQSQRHGSNLNCFFENL